MRAFVLVLLTLALFGERASAAAFEISLRVLQGERHAATTRPANDAKAIKKRQVFEGDAAHPFTAKWKVVRAARQEAKDVLVHYYVVKIERPGQAPPPLEPKRVIIESALTMDFPPGQSSESSVQVRIDEPGLYLMRIETGSGDQPEAQDFAEIELLVK